MTRLPLMVLSASLFFACGDDGGADAGADAALRDGGGIDGGGIDSGSVDGGGIDGGSVDGGGVDSAMGDAGTGRPLVGTILIQEVDAPFGAIGRGAARLTTGGLPRAHLQTMREGACRLLEYRTGTCPGRCDGICAAPDECIDFMAYQSAGRLTVAGTRTRLTMTFDAFTGYFGTSRMADLFGAGDVVTVSADGAAVPAFSISTAGVTDLVADVVRGEISLANGADYTFRWTPSGDMDARVRVTLNSNNRGHFYPFEAIIECDGPDTTGSLVIPRAMIEAFPMTYRWELCAGSDCPLSSVLRYTRSTVPSGSGDIELLVGSAIEFFVLHDAL